MAKKIDRRQDAYLPPDIAHMVAEFSEGKAIGDTSRIDFISENFSWKRGFVNCWTGWPNDGKTTFFQFLAVVKSAVDGWKWGIWPPEMIDSWRDDQGTVRISASDIYDDLIFMFTGKNPYKHYVKRYGVPQMTLDEYHAALEWVEKHFFVMYPREKKYKDIIDHFQWLFEEYGVDGFLVDPWKNLDQDENGRTDLSLDRAFSEIKDFSIMTNTTFNIIAHPRSEKEPKNKDGSYKICNAHMLAGGAAWYNNMDGIYSIYRQYRHNDPKDPRAMFFNLKQRKQQLVARVGLYDKIEFDFLKNRFFFDGVCPIDGSVKDPVQGSIKFPSVADRKTKSIESAIKFDTIGTIDYSQPERDPDDVPF